MRISPNIHPKNEGFKSDFMGKSLINGGFYGKKITKSEDFPGRQVMTITDNLCLWLAGRAPF